MKIIVMGGAGDMGSRTVEDLAATDDVTRVTIADCNEKAAQKVADKVSGGAAKVDVKKVDADNHEELVAAIKGYDVAASTLGPFYRFESKLVRAALDAGVNYTSVCDDWTAAEEVLDQFDDRAKSEGRIILTGLGTSPGFTSVSIRYLMGKLDTIESADIYVYQPLNAGGGAAVVRHMLFVITGKLASWRGGKKVMLRACSQSKTVKFPEFGKIKLWNMGHTEPVSVPRFIPEIQHVNFFMGFGKGAEFFVYPAQLGLFQNKTIFKLTARIAEIIEKAFPDDVTINGAVRIDVWGKKDGKRRRKMIVGVGQMREATGLSLSVGTLMVARGELTTTKGGVYAPEACIQPELFFSRMKDKGLQAFEDLEMTIPVG